MQGRAVGAPCEVKGRRRDWEPADHVCANLAAAPKQGLLAEGALAQEWAQGCLRRSDWPPLRGQAVIGGWLLAAVSKTSRPSSRFFPAGGLSGASVCLPWRGGDFSGQTFSLEKKGKKGKECGGSQITFAHVMHTGRRVCVVPAQKALLTLPFTLSISLQILLAGGRVDSEASRACSPTIT